MTASLTPAELYDRTVALALNRVGESAAGMALRPRTEQALADYEATTGRRPATSGRASSGELSNVLLTADLLAALCHCEAKTSAAAVVAGFESITQRPIASGADVTFRPGEHWGFRGARQVRWSAKGGTWLAAAPYRALP